MRDYRRIGDAATLWPKVFAQLALVFTLLLLGGGWASAQNRDWPRDRDQEYVPPQGGPYHQGGPYYNGQGMSDEGRRIAEERGYRTGLDRGRDDVNHRRSFNPRRSEHFRDGDSGYHSQYGSLAAYRGVYRQAFRRGYDEGYRGNSRGSYYPPSSYPQGYPQNGPYYGGVSYGGLTDEGRRVAEDRGYRVGVERGRDDANNRRGFNPNNSEHFRDGDSGYRSQYGNIEGYRAAYRDAFRRGYEDGYGRYGRY